MPLFSTMYWWVIIAEVYRNAERRDKNNQVTCSQRAHQSAGDNVWPQRSGVQQPLWAASLKDKYLFSELDSHVIIPLMTLGSPLNSSGTFKGAFKSPSRCSGQGEQTTPKFCDPGAGAHENSLHPRERRKQGRSCSLQQCHSPALAHAVVWRRSGMLVNAWAHRTSANWNLRSVC